MQTKPAKKWMSRVVILFSIVTMFSCQNVKEKDKLRSAYPISGVAFNQVQLNDHFWLPKIKVNRDYTIPAAFQKCEEMGRMDNFLIAGGKMAGPVKGEMPFDDTDVYKTIEGAAYSLTTFPDPKLDAYVDSIIAIIAVGQEADGYLTTYKTIDTTNAPASWCPAGSRWQNLECSHELYNSGHLFEAAAAHYAATGKTNFLDIALKNADLLVKVFTEEHPGLVPGHQIVETGLIKLYLITQNEDYLKLARHFLDTRGDSSKHRLNGPYTQDHKPVTQQDEAVGHAVRAAYMYAGMTDIAAFYNDSAYTAAVENIWNNVVSKKMYLTGGIGSRHDGEAFGDNYELPNTSAYNETCAAIANVYWNYRMFLLKGEAKYLDVLERSLYNNVISSVSLDGTHFFYPNPLECNMHYPFNRGALTRQPWFDCSCCPTNLARFMPSVAGYIYAHHEQDLYVNLYVQSSTEVDLDQTKVAIRQETNYPWDGTVKLTVKPEAASNFNLKLRIPGWSINQPVPSDLYSYEKAAANRPVIKINDQKVDYETEKGFAVLNHNWQEGDEVELILLMEVKKVLANENVEDDRGKVAIERGPIVYCLEETDNPQIDQAAVTPDSEFSTSFDANLLHGVEVITASGNTKNENFKAIPYFVWNNRGANKMKVWLNQ